MKIGFVVNDIATEKPVYTTTRLAMTADPARARRLPDRAAGLRLRAGRFTVRDRGGRERRQGLPLARAVPRGRADGRPGSGWSSTTSMSSCSAPTRPWTPRRVAWANTAGLAFGHLLADTGVLVVNDPRSLADAMSKAYFQHFPEVVRPRTMISRDEERVRQFIEELGGRAVLKPLQGSGGSGVFLVNMKEEPNITQIVEAIARDGYVVAQEYLPAAKDGDVRMFVMNGRALRGRRRVCRLPPAAGRDRRAVQHVRRRQRRGGQGDRRDASARGSRAPQTARRRHVPRRPRHRRRQADGGQRVLARRPRVVRGRCTAWTSRPPSSRTWSARRGSASTTARSCRTSSARRSDARNVPRQEGHVSAESGARL